jgi:hypothetical protein
MPPRHARDCRHHDAAMLARTVARLTTRQRAQRALVALARRPDLTRLQRLRRPEFEACVCELERSVGSRVRHAGRTEGCRGMYLVLREDGERVALSCKHWPHARAGTNEIERLRGLMARVRAVAGVLVTCGELDDAALGCATGDIELVDGRTLLERIARQRDGAR